MTQNLTRISTKWQTSAIKRRPRKKRIEWVPHHQLYAEIEEGFQYFVQKRMKEAVLGK